MDRDFWSRCHEALKLFLLKLLIVSEGLICFSDGFARFLLVLLSGDACGWGLDIPPYHQCQDGQGNEPNTPKAKQESKEKGE
jgi:hypothetical protein